MRSGLSFLLDLFVGITLFSPLKELAGFLSKAARGVASSSTSIDQRSVFSALSFSERVSRDVNDCFERLSFSFS